MGRRGQNLPGVPGNGHWDGMVQGLSDLPIQSLTGSPFPTLELPIVSDASGQRAAERKG